MVMLKCCKKPESLMTYSYVPREIVQVASTYDVVKANLREYSTCKLVQLAKTPKKNTIEYDNVHKSMTSTNAYFNIKPAAENPVFHPDKKGKIHDRNGNVADIDGRFARTAIAPAIEIAVEFTHGNKKHTSSVQWLFGPVYDHETDKQVRCIIPGSDVITQHLDAKMPYIEIKFQSDFDVGTKLDPPSDFSLTDYDKFMIQQLKSFCHPKKSHPVHLRFYFHSKEVTELQETNSTEYKFIESVSVLAHSRPKLRTPFAGYKNNSGEVQAIANQMKGRSAIITKGTPLEAHPPVARCIDAPHNLLTLANGHYLDNTEEQDKLHAPVQRRAYLLTRWLLSMISVTPNWQNDK
ncbi:hypothetical protein LTR17_013852 [Elasticomyces elasticus]|nr:hypothetical protein LTR17_013852 [Elasticomyces elasticus]